MTIKIFAEHGSFKLLGDAQGFTVPSKQRQSYYKWCGDNSIETEYHGTMAGLDLWYVKNEQDRMLAVLRWS